MQLDLAVQQQLINTIHVTFPDPVPIGPLGSLSGDNFLYLSERDLVQARADGPKAADGSRSVTAELTATGRTFVHNTFGDEVVLKHRIRTALIALNPSQTQLQKMRHTVEALPGGVQKLLALRLIDLGLTGNEEAIAATREYLMR